MKAISSFETLVTIYQSTRRHIPEHLESSETPMWEP